MLLQFPNEIYLQQKAIFTFDAPRLFKILDVEQNLLLELEEEKKYNLWQLFFKSKKPFNMELVFNNKKFKFVKKSKLLSDMLAVFDTNNELIAFIKKDLFKDIKVYDQNEKVIFKLKSDLLLKKDFDVYSDNSIGKISKNMPKLKEIFTDADTFYINFPLNMTLENQVTIIAITIFIDSIYFDD